VNRHTTFASPYLLGFEHLERLLERAARGGGDSYPPCNIELISESALRITLAVAGFASNELSVTEGPSTGDPRQAGGAGGQNVPSPGPSRRDIFCAASS
jgi:hypothetical protein